jgi:dipeptidyl aminopeptidase/acylaminoacyl peptidase
MLQPVDRPAGRQVSASIAVRACAIVALSAGLAHAEDAPPATAFAASAEFSYIALAPDGRTIALDRWTGDGHKVVLLEPGQEIPRRVLALAQGDKLRGLSWADADTALIEISGLARYSNNVNNTQTLFEFFRTVAADIGGGAPRMLLPEDEYLRTNTRVIGPSPGKPDKVLIQAWDYSSSRARQTIDTRLQNARADSGYVDTLYEVDTGTGKDRLLERGTSYTQEWAFDAQGRPVGRLDRRVEAEHSSLYGHTARGWSEVHRVTGREDVALGGLTADGKSLVFLGENGTANARVWSVPLDGSAPPALLHEVPGTDIAAIYAEPASQALLGYRTGGLTGTMQWLDPARAVQQRKLDKAFPGRVAHIMDRSVDGRRILANVESPSHPSTIYLVDFEKGAADIVGEGYVGLAGATLAEVRAIQYLARDGVSIPAYLLVPPGRKAENLPLVVMPHGGPESRDEFAFDWLAQFVATRGYAVLQPQFRGSTGFGRAHRLAGYGEWGGRMQDDVSDGVRHAVASGIADPSRVCIVGASYGGYAALAGAAFRPDLYACAVSINGVSDLPLMLGDLERRGGEDSDAIAYWKQHIGKATDPKLPARSPARSPQSIRAPVLLMHGEFDTVVSPRQSEVMAAALQGIGRPVEYVKLPGEDHWLSQADTRVQVLERIEQFLESHLGANAAARP